jgi:hypothetical protein
LESASHKQHRSIIGRAGLITVLSPIRESENHQGAKSAKDHFLRGLGCESFRLGAPVGRFAKPVRVGGVELFFYRVAGKYYVLLGDPWRSWRLGGFFKAYWGQKLSNYIFRAGKFSSLITE